MDKKRLVPLSLLLASLTLVGAGCGSSASVSVNAPAGTQAAPAPAPAPAPGGIAASTCGNPYYPFKSGLAITYGITSSVKGAPPADYTLKIVDVKGTTATIRTEMANGFSADLEADCADGTVALKGSIDLGSMMQGAKVKTTVVSSSGTFMPNNVAIGSVWDSAQTVKVEMTGAPQGMGPVTTTTKSESKAVANEKVTVPAGTYDALKVEVTRTTSTEGMTMPEGVKLPPGMKMPTIPPVVTTSTEWWVKGVGMVKTVTESKGYSSTVEAKSITGL